MANGQTIRSIVAFVWREYGVVVPPEEQPRFYLALDDLVRQAVEQRVQEELRRRVLTYVSRN